MNSYIKMSRGGQRSIRVDHLAEYGCWTVAARHRRSGATYSSDIGTCRGEAEARQLAHRNGAKDAFDAPLIHVVSIVALRTAGDPRIPPPPPRTNRRHRPLKNNPLYARTIIGTAETKDDALAMANAAATANDRSRIVVAGVGYDDFALDDGRPARVPDYGCDQPHAMAFMLAAPHEQQTMIEALEASHGGHVQPMLDICGDADRVCALAGACATMNAATPGRINSSVERTVSEKATVAERQAPRREAPKPTNRGR